MKLLFLLCLSLGCAVAEPAKLIFIKSFPGSTPAYVFLEVSRTGALLYKEDAEDPNPLKASLKASDAEPLFNLAEKLGYFKDPVESGLKVANTGKKTFRYQPETGPAVETVFNYSIIPAAQELLDKFEQISSTEQALIVLDQTIHFDKLGVNDALAQIESLWLKKQLAAPEQFIPLLTRISSKTTFMHLVRDRAARLKDEFTGTVPPTASSQQKPPQEQ